MTIRFNKRGEVTIPWFVVGHDLPYETVQAVMQAVKAQNKNKKN